MKKKEILLLIAMIVLLVVFFTNDNKFVEIVTGIPILIILRWEMIAIQRSNIDSKLKRNPLNTTVVTSSIMGRINFQIMK